MVTRCSRISSAAAMYSSPSGSIRKNGPRPKRSLPGTGRSSRTCIRSRARLSSSSPSDQGDSVESVLIFARRHTTFVFGIAIAAGLSGAFLVSRVSFDANVLRLLPQRSPSVRDFRLFLRNFGSLDHLYLVFETAGAIGDHDEL